MVHIPIRCSSIRMVSANAILRHFGNPPPDPNGALIGCPGPNGARFGASVRRDGKDEIRRAHPDVPFTRRTAKFRSLFPRIFTCSGRLGLDCPTSNVVANLHSAIERAELPGRNKSRSDG